MSTYIIKASWRATAKVIKIEAPNETLAVERAWKSRHVKDKGCLEIYILRKQ